MIDARQYPGNPNQEQTDGKLFISTNVFSVPKVGQYYRGWHDQYAYLCENEDFPEDPEPHLILEPLNP